jgi:hypothetical protein
VGFSFIEFIDFLIMPAIGSLGSNLDVVKLSFIVFVVGGSDSNLRVCFKVSFIIIDVGYLDVNFGATLCMFTMVEMHVFFQKMMISLPNERHG